MESGNPDLVKHTDYPVSNSNTFGDSPSHDVRIRVPNAEEERLVDSAQHPIPPPEYGSAMAEPSTTTVLIPDSDAMGETATRSRTDGHEEIQLVPVPMTGSSSNIDQFAIEDHLRNNEKNPNKESTNVIPILVRKAHSYEVLPRPFRTTNQFICFAYFSVLLCCFCGTFATKWAWKAKLQRNQGLYIAAKKSAGRALKYIIGAFVAFLFFGGIAIIIYIDRFSNSWD